MARGHGETISSLSTLAGCKSDAAVGSTLQSNFKQIFPNEKVSDQKVSDSVVRTLQQNKGLSCQSLS
ncbi:MAG: DUF3015 family protein [Myxococcales bacterium]|nr:MAG: DUF3015 family protein [Myxococcales bacterium]